MCTLGASVRGTLALERAARAWALLDEREYVVSDDVEQLFLPVIAHRVAFRPAFRAQARRDRLGRGARGVPRRVPARVPAPELRTTPAGVGARRCPTRRSSSSPAAASSGSRSVRCAARGAGPAPTSRARRPYVPGDTLQGDRLERDRARCRRRATPTSFVLREQYADEAPRVVVIADRRPEMQLFPARSFRGSESARRSGGARADPSEHDRGARLPRLPRLRRRRRRAVLAAAAVAVAVGVRRPRGGRRAVASAPRRRSRTRFEFLLAHPRSVPAGTFVFVLSDFLAPPPSETWLRALEHRWDVIPVVLQDPLWERSFPPVDGFGVDVADVEGASHEVHLTRGESAEQRRGARDALGRVSSRASRARRSSPSSSTRTTRASSCARSCAGPRRARPAESARGEAASRSPSLLARSGSSPRRIARRRRRDRPDADRRSRPSPVPLRAGGHSRPRRPRQHEGRRSGDGAQTARASSRTSSSCAAREDERDGSVVRVRYTYRLTCDSLACTTGPRSASASSMFPADARPLRDAQREARIERPRTGPGSVSSLARRRAQFRPQTATEAERGLPTDAAPRAARRRLAPRRRTGSTPTTGAIALFAAALLALRRRGVARVTGRRRARAPERERRGRSCRPSSARCAAVDDDRATRARERRASRGARSPRPRAPPRGT